MNRLEKLIQNLCPNGVKYIEINDLIKSKIIKIVSPSIKIKKNEFFTQGCVPIISQEQEYISGYTNVSDEKIVKDEYVCFGDHSEHIKYVDFKFVQGADGLKIISVVQKSIVNPKYLYYSTCNYYIRYNNYERHFKYFRQMKIPIPPLPVQEEIVRILDNFTELTAKLIAELSLRKKQYEYYRDELFNIDKKTFDKLGNLCDLKAGATPKTSIKEYWDNGTIPWMSSGEVNLKKIYKTEKCITHKGYDNSSTKLIPKESVIVALAGQGKTRGTVAMNMIPLCTNQSLCSLICGNRINPYFLYYYLQTQYENLRYISSGDGNRGGLNLKMLSSYMIPIPSLEEQQRIVDILDRFDRLCNDISEGLPAEIEARQKQYEYYRDKLLTFKPLETNY